MTKAKIVVAAKVGHPVVVRAPVADAAPAHAATLQPRADSTKPAHPRHAGLQAMRTAKKSSGRAVLPNRALLAKAPAKSVPLSQELSVALVIAQRAQAARRIAPSPPARRAKAQVARSAALRQEGIGQEKIDQEQIDHVTIGQDRIAPPATGATSLRAFRVKPASRPRQKKIRASVSPRSWRESASVRAVMPRSGF